MTQVPPAPFPSTPFQTSSPPRHSSPTHAHLVAVPHSRLSAAAGSTSSSTSSPPRSATLPQPAFVHATSPQDFGLVEQPHPFPPPTVMTADQLASSSTTLPEASGLVRTRDDSGPSSQPADGEHDPDFTQTFYDPFRIKHRRRTSPPQLKILEYHFERNPKPDVNLRKALSDQLDMTPREVQVWFQNRRAKTKKLREKMEKEGVVEEQTSTTRTYESSSSSSAYSINGGRPMPMAHHQGGMHMAANPDFHHLARRGSSPAVLGPSFDYYDNGSFPPPPPPHPLYQSSQIPPRQPVYHPLPPQHSLPPAPTSIYPSPLSLSPSGQPSPSHSPNEATVGGGGDFATLASPPRMPSYDDQTHANARRFSLPAYPSSYPATLPSWNGKDAASLAPNQTIPLPPPPHQPFAPSNHFGSSNGYPAPREGGPLSDTELVSPPSVSGWSPEFSFGIAREEHGNVGDEYSPSSSADEQSASGYDYSYRHGSISGPSGMDAPLSQYSFGSSTTVDESMSPVDLNNPMFSPGGRRSSCPAGFLPNFDNLGISNGSSPASNAPPASSSSTWSPVGYTNGTSAPLSLPPQHPSMQKRHSIASPGGGAYPPQYSVPPPSSSHYAHGPTSSPSSSSALPPTSFPYSSSPQFLPDRRGSTSSLLGTIAEQAPMFPQSQPYVVPTSTSPEMMSDSTAGGADRGHILGRKARSQANLRATPYAQDQRRPSLVGGVPGGPSIHERRGSAPGGVPDFSDFS